MSHSKGEELQNGCVEACLHRLSRPLEPIGDLISDPTHGRSLRERMEHEVLHQAAAGFSMATMMRAAHINFSQVLPRWMMWMPSTVRRKT